MPVAEAVYLGDGAYAKKGRTFNEVILFTGDGETENNLIYLGPDELKTLFGWYSRLQEEGFIK